MNKEVTGRLILEASTGMHGDVAKQLSDAWSEMASEVQRLQALSVTNILLDVVPGDGSGLEIYAESPDDVVKLLSKLCDQAEALRDDLQEAARTLRRYEELHRAKNTPNSLAKAEANATLAARFERTLSTLR